MVYANDQWVQLPTKDLYDSQIMAIAINAAKDMYEKGQEEIKDFNKLYGDFYTPIIGDQSKYDQEVMQPVRNVINAIYAAGGDPLRSPEARGLINKAIYNIDTAKVALLRQRADLAKEYYKNLGALKAKGLYSEDFSKGFLKEDPQQWAEDYIGSTSPTELQTLKQATESFYNNRTAHILDKAGVESFGIPYDPRYSYTGFTDKDIMDIAAKNAPGFSGTPIADYYRYLAEKKVAASGLPYTQADVENQFQKDIAQANVEWKIAPQRTADQFAVTNQQFKNSLALQKNSQEFQREQARQAAKDKLDQIIARYGNRPGGAGTRSSNKQPVSYYEPMYQNLVINTINNDPHRTQLFGNKEFSTDLGVDLYRSQQNIAEDYFGDGTVKSIYGSNTSTKGTSFGFNPKIRWDNGNAVLDMNPTTGLSRSTSIDINKTIRQDLTNSEVFKRKFNDKYNDYLNRMSLDFESGMFANSWNHGESKVSEVTQDGKTIEKLRGKNYVYMSAEDVDKIYSGKELAARAAGATGKVLEDAINETKMIRNAFRSGNNIMRGSGKMLGVGLSDTGQYGMYAKIHVAQYDGNSKLSNECDAYIMTPYQSAPNANFKETGAFNLEFDQTLDLSRKNIDNAAIRKFGVSSNSGTIDNTIPDSNPWYILDDYDWVNDDIE